MNRVAILLLVSSLYSNLGAREPIEVDGGKISGSVSDGIRSFKGVPYAAPPIGDLRWQPPQPVVAWKGVRVCDKYSPICPQKDYPIGSIYRSAPQPKNEDCLYLNIWTPEKADRSALPVMVWIHGGAWTRGSGSNPYYDGSELAKRGVVLVTINYRLGPFGFFAHPELSSESPTGASGNQGILDALAALQWIQNNIDRFGGDPGNVTIFGESAGSWSVSALVATPLAKGLIHRAIGQSGARFGSAPWLDKRSEATPSGHLSGHDSGIAFMKACGAESLAELRKLSAEKILDTKFVTQIVVDGYVFPDSIASIFAAGKQNRVPAIVGSNADEMTSLSNPATNPRTIDEVEDVISKNNGEQAFAIFKMVYDVSNDVKAARSYLHAGGDAGFALGMRRWARWNDQAGIDSYLYYFTHAPPGPGSDYLGAHHAAEIPYVFDNANSIQQRPFAETDQKLADMMADYWVNFARAGDPNGEGLPSWPEYDRDSQSYLEIDPTPEAKTNLLERRLDFWEAIMP